MMTPKIYSDNGIMPVARLAHVPTNRDSCRPDCAYEFRCLHDVVLRQLRAGCAGAVGDLRLTPLQPRPPPPGSPLQRRI